MARILVTGGAGYIGSHTVKRLLERGHHVVVYDNLSYGHRAAVPQHTLVVGDLRDVDHLDHVLVVHRIDAVIHFAALTNVSQSVRDPASYYLQNLLHSLNLLERVRRQGIQRFVFSSTCATYGLPSRLPIEETDPQNPITPYGQTKLMVERMLADYAQPYQIGYACLRYFNAAGADPDGSIGEDHSPETHLIPLAIQTALGLRPHLDIFGTDYPTPDGTCIRDYVHVDDLAMAHILAVEQIQPGQGWVFNVGLGKGYSVRDVIATVEQLAGRKIPLREQPRRPGDPPILTANAQAIHRQLGWTPHYPDLLSIVETAWNWHRRHPQGFNDRLNTSATLTTDNP